MNNGTRIYADDFWSAFAKEVLTGVGLAVPLNPSSAALCRNNARLAVGKPSKSPVFPQFLRIFPAKPLDSMGGICYYRRH
jgi:hypothetical protein